MKRVAFVSAIIATVILALPGFCVGSIVLGCAAIAIGAMWLLILWKSVKRTELTILLGAETAIAVVNILYGASVYLAGIAIVLAVMSWDFALTETSIASFPAKMTKGFTIRHVIRMGIIAVIGLALLVIPLQIHIQIGFRTALGLGLGTFMLLAVLLKLIDTHSTRSARRYQIVIDGLAILREAMKKKDGRS
ncbi:MAG: hypothetical protein U9Q94_00970 [Candidatus Bipolaricaulota bacterium]|nr:hypothetical protein [Candidatus Bipolaricaulota bacterium]